MTQMKHFFNQNDLFEIFIFEEINNVSLITFLPAKNRLRIISK